MSRIRDIANILSGGSSDIATDSEIPSHVAGKNFIVNGNFDFWQRGTSFSALGAPSGSTYTADRWNSGANNNITLSRVSASTEGSIYGLRLQKNSGTSSGGDAFICHTIESNNVIMLAGKTVTLSFNVRKGSDFSGAAVYCVPRFGTAIDQGSTLGYNGQWTGTNQVIHTVSPTTTMTRYTKTFVVPSGTKEMMLLMGAQSLAATSAGANDWIEFEKIQLELGSVSTGFSRAGGDIQGEFARCQRYYQVLQVGSGYLPLAVNNLSSFSNSYASSMSFPTSMRVTPSLSFTDISGNQSRFSGYASSGTRTDNLTGGVNINEFGIRMYVSGNYAYIETLNAVANAEL
jgi:hypothetical protein